MFGAGGLTTVWPGVLIPSHHMHSHKRTFHSKEAYMNLVEKLADALAAVEEDYRREAELRLKDVQDLSLNEREVLDDMGQPYEWPKKFLEVGRSAFALARNLNAVDFLPTYIVQDAVDPARPYRGVPELGLELEAARQVIASISGTVQRTQHVIWSTVHGDISPRVTEYLKRLGRCYVAGFFPEVVILCRAVLDTALRDVLGDMESDRLNMADRIKAAGRHGLLSPEALSAADAIRHRGNHAVHEEPADPGITNDTLEKTVLVLSELLYDMEE